MSYLAQNFDLCRSSLSIMNDMLMICAEIEPEHGVPQMGNKPCQQELEGHGNGESQRSPFDAHGGNQEQQQADVAKS